MNLRRPRIIYGACRPFTKNKEQIKKLKETDEFKYILRKKQIKHTFSIIWLMQILKIYLEELIQIRYYAIKHLKLQKIYNMTDIKEDLLHCFKKLLMNNISGSGIKSKLMIYLFQIKKPIIRKFKKFQVYSSQHMGVDLADL